TQNMDSSQWSEDSISSPVSLDILKDPVSLPCGHSYCLGCIKSHWDQDDQTGVYSCPQCRQTFTPRPVLRRNTLLGEVVEKLKETGLSGPPAPSPAGPGEVLCDVCTGRQVRAVKSCLVCLASYCQTHLQPHCEAAPLKRHQLVEATGQLQEKTCPDHQKLREVYCRTDQTCVCLLCSETEREWTEKQEQLGATQTQTQQRLQEREKELQELRQAVDSLRVGIDQRIQDTDRIFTELIRSIERTRSELTQLIRAQERAAVSQAEGLLERLEQEIAELRRRDAELSQISHTEDHIHFLQNFQSVCVPPGAGDSPSIPVRPHFSPEAVRRAVSGLIERLEDVCREESVKISRTEGEKTHLSLPLWACSRQKTPTPTVGLFKIENSHSHCGHVQDRKLPLPLWMCLIQSHSNCGCVLSASFCCSSVDRLVELFSSSLQSEACQLTLDPNTAHRHLRLSEGNRRVTWSREPQQYPDHPERFDSEFQVLCREGLSGTRCYWEVEWSGIGITYKGLSRRGWGDSSRLGRNDQSWSLCCSGSSCSFWHNKEKTAVAAPPSSRIGVYVDHRAGTLSFYSVSGDTATLLHRVQASFTEPLYPGFGGYGILVGQSLFVSSAVTLCPLG
ncbi:STXB protein, partial [Atractosteus spatula]|nr:STXB protein [Atractosteus spatula]